MRRNSTRRIWKCTKNGAIPKLEHVAGLPLRMAVVTRGTGGGGIAPSHILAGIEAKPSPSKSLQLKFVFSKKATVDLTLTTYYQFDDEYFVNFVAFLENTNFTKDL